MSTQRTLAIVIPAYNEERHLKACLQSIAAQTEKPDEVIVVDNNSSDATAAIARSFPFVRVISEKKQGPLHARNRGFDSVKSDLIGRIDADTILPENWVARVRQFYDVPDHIDQALTGGCYFYNVRLPRFNGWWQDQIAFRVNRFLMGHYILFGSNMVLPRRIWRGVRHDTCSDDDIHEDLDLAIHVHRAGYDITYQASLVVGVKMRRVRSNRQELWDNLKWWPNTLRRHHRWTWVFGWFGALLLYLGFPVVLAAEFIARLFGRPPLPE